ncbi:hypothetical protein SPRG_06275 [Saprolegnia parasitica CBS 223.65]|uniref:Uncharacterized protein n=1 Tax=Saprolegnia parasitica (strain CBS 223.65) TaxID=695850 RepID=A0A067CNY8_SAPPC|nr:hypothetical protein SPRG_06275 [Saprolegnia parasitica CBS 223.65]KDO28226.1 hypothetical protein SPRG_06275 [Saprolegnia parasitica CBS 223.65]|eukprot:XP_012201051.1 hypothetical protein SPRG_06275 [Saprolegnia parasitica CBS 223.65]
MATRHPTAVFSPRKALARLQVQPAPSSALGALAESEKDAIILYLLQKVRDQQTMQDATIKFGEQVAAQLVLEQHRAAEAHEATIRELQDQLHAAVHDHPEVRRLQSAVAELQFALDTERHNVLSAIQKCRRSREREKQLKMTIDPLWE